MSNENDKTVVWDYETQKLFIETLISISKELCEIINSEKK